VLTVACLNHGDSLPGSRKDALRLSRGRYFTGVACSRGHVVARYTASGHCTACASPEAVKRTRAWRLANPDRARSLAKEYSERPATIAKRRAAARTPTYREKKKLARRERVKLLPWIAILSQARVRSTRKKIPYELSSAWAKARWTGRCELTNEPFRYSAGRSNPYSPSIDRIDSSKGYTESNSRFILWSLNQFRGRHSDLEMFDVARLLLKAEGACR
jgi:hypothetical protein